MKWTPTRIKAAVVIALGVLLVGITIWRTHPGRQKRTSIDYAKAKYMHCPQCNAEVRYEDSKLDAECVQCGSTKGMVATEETIKQQGTRSRYGRMIAFLMPEVCLFLTALWFVLRPRPDAGSNEFRYMRCAKCSQKLRYRTAQVGGAGACSRCKRVFVFPEGVPREEDLDSAAVSGETT